MWRDWQSALTEHGLGWVTARDGARLVGFVNVIWDGLAHAWIQDTMVARDARSQGIGTHLVQMAREQAEDAGCKWLHVDFGNSLADFYYGACGFAPTSAGLIPLEQPTARLPHQAEFATSGVPSGATDNSGSIRHTGGMDTLRHSGSIVIKRSPESLYDIVADVTRVGEWSPMCTACWWDEGDGPHIGAKFTGRNERPERTWETRSEVVRADRGRQFSWVVVEPPTGARWGYSFVAVDGGTELTETWELPPEGSTFFEKMFGDDAAKEIGIRSDWAKNGIEATLAAIKGAAEG